MTKQEFYQKTSRLMHMLADKYPGPGCIEAVCRERDDLWGRIVAADEEASKLLRVGEVDDAARAMKVFQDTFLEAFDWYRVEYGNESDFPRGEVPEEARAAVRMAAETLGEPEWVEYRRSDGAKVRLTGDVGAVRVSSALGPNEWRRTGGSRSFES